MAEIIILPFTGLDERYIEDLAYRLDNVLPHKVLVSPSTFDPEFAFIAERNQYFSTKILEVLAEEKMEPDSRILGVTNADLFIPILTYVFGESMLNGPAAVVSLYRLNPEIYGYPVNNKVLMNRLEKVAIHELGHSFGLQHCPDYRCVMHASNVVEGVDFKGKTYCRQCLQGLGFKLNNI